MLKTFTSMLLGISTKPGINLFVNNSIEARNISAYIGSIIDLAIPPDTEKFIGSPSQTKFI